MESRSTKILFSKRALLLTGVLLVPLSTSAIAQTADEKNSASGFEAKDEIVVTAQKRSERLSDVPASIEALTASSLRQRGVANFNDLGRQTPGLTMVKRQSNVSNVVMRGIGAYGNVQGTGFYVDDVQNFTDQIMRPMDVERVEILKGPQGTLYGGSSLGGAIKYVMKQPTFSTTADFEGEVGGHDYYSLSGALNTPISEKVAVRISGHYSHDDGFIKETVNFNKRSNQTTEYAARAQILLKPSDDFTATINLRTRTLETGVGYVVHSDRNPKYTTGIDIFPDQRIRVWGASAHLNYDLGGTTLTSITSATRQTWKQRIDADYTAVPRIIGGATDSTPTTVYTQELRLTSDTGGKIDWIAGLYALRGRNSTFPPTPLNVTIIPLNLTLSPYNYYNTVQTDLAGFGTVNLHLNNLTLSAGARVSHTRYKTQSFFVDGAPTNQTYYADNPVVVLPKLTASYKTPGGTTLYAGISEGYEAGKVDPQVDPANPYRSEISWAYEAGMKGYLFDRHLYYEVAGYYIDETRRQVENTGVTSDGAVIKGINNIGDSTSIGAEAHLEWRPTPEINFSASGGYLDAKWSKGAVFEGNSLKGRQIPNAPHWTGNFGASFTPSLSDDYQLTFNTNATYSGPFQWTLSYLPVSNTQPSYWVVTSRIGIARKDGRWEVAVRAENLFDKKYFTEFVPGIFGPQQADGTCVNCHLGAPAARRRITASLSVKM